MVDIGQDCIHWFYRDQERYKRNCSPISKSRFSIRIILDFPKYSLQSSVHGTIWRMGGISWKILGLITTLHEIDWGKN